MAAFLDALKKSHFQAANYYIMFLYACQEFFCIFFYYISFI